MYQRPGGKGPYQLSHLPKPHSPFLKTVSLIRLGWLLSSFQESTVSASPLLGLQTPHLAFSSFPFSSFSLMWFLGMELGSLCLQRPTNPLREKKEILVQTRYSSHRLSSNKMFLLSNAYSVLISETAFGYNMPRRLMVSCSCGPSPWELPGTEASLFSSHFPPPVSPALLLQMD